MFALWLIRNLTIQEDKGIGWNNSFHTKQKKAEWYSESRDVGQTRLFLQDQPRAG